ncbi:MAG: AAA family ATPase [Bryobacterales bacterium]|nr:AAA family ATPase [Bryobacterales bacterium]
MSSLYNAFFGFKENPFNLTPDPVFLYRSNQHQEALANLQYGVQSRKGFIALTGEVGTGKTTLLECLRDFLSQNRYDFATIFNSRLTVAEFFELLNHDLDLRCNPPTKTQVLLTLNDFLLKNTHAGRTTVLIVDEAQNLSWEVLEEIRLLGNLENRAGKLLQIIMAGQPEFDSILDDPTYRQLKQRVALRCTLRAFEEADTRQYIYSRLLTAGCEEPEHIFPEPIVSEIHVRTQGIPRIINSVSDNLLLTAFATSSKQVTLDMLDEVSSDLRLEWNARRITRERIFNDQAYPRRMAGRIE